MKFGTTLRKAIYEPWKDEYLDYNKLKKLLREDDTSPAGSPDRKPDDTWTDEDAQNFYAELVNNQLEKVKNFHKSVYQRLRDSTSKCEEKLEPVAASVKLIEGTEEQDQAKAKANGDDGKKALPSQEERRTILTEVLDDLDRITNDVNELEKYSRINYTGFLKIAKKHDRKRGGRVSSVRPLVKSMLADVPFNKEDYSPLLYRLSAMYSFARQNLDEKDLPLSMAESLTGSGESYTSHKCMLHCNHDKSSLGPA